MMTVNNNLVSVALIALSFFSCHCHGRIRGLQQQQQLLQPARRQCAHDLHCIEGDGYCSEGECRPRGYCSSVRDCLNPSNIYATIRCFGYIECFQDQERCNIQCSPSSCPPDKPEPNCIAKPDPCSVTTCNEPYEQCINDFCGGCNALFFNASGHQVCEQQTQGNCSSTSDCLEGEYCAGGECVEHGSCNIDADCYNPQNQFDNTTNPNGCDMVCDAESGTCQADCSNDCRPCGTGADPCELQSCSYEDALCVNDHCNCDAIFFMNETGYQICHEEERFIDLGINFLPPGFGGGQGDSSVAFHAPPVLNAIPGLPSPQGFSAGRRPNTPFP